MSDTPMNPLTIPMPPAISLGGTLGVLVIAAQLSAVLYGVTTVQTFIYHQHRERDPKALRYSIYLLWHVSRAIIDTFQFICMLHLSYFYCVKNFGNPIGLNAIPWTWSAFMVMTPINGVLVTSWYAHRVWKLSRNIWVILLIGVATVSSLVGGIALSVLRSVNTRHLRYTAAHTNFIQRETPDVFYIHPSSPSKYSLAWPWYLWVSSQIVSDVTITIFLTVSLLRRKTNLARTGSIVNLIIMYSLGTCLISSAITIAMVVTSTMLPAQFYDSGLAALLPKFTLNSLLAMLNTRDFLRSKMYHDNAEPVPMHLLRLPGSSVEAVAGPRTSPYTGDSIASEAFDSSRNSCDAISFRGLGIHVEKLVIQV
ncbi:hypothetical protein BDW22DRAFT_1431103 [Trametopsis cervina]|nr:hypothetical protein BDW22DRAFT_1431103 [Trametopsis cervina]